MRLIFLRKEAKIWEVFNECHWQLIWVKWTVNYWLYVGVRVCRVRNGNQLGNGNWRKARMLHPVQEKHHLRHYISKGFPRQIFAWVDLFSLFIWTSQHGEWKENEHRLSLISVSWFLIDISTIGSLKNANTKFTKWVLVSSSCWY